VRTFALQIVGALVVGTFLLAAGYYIRDHQVSGDRRAPPDSDSVATAAPDTTDPIELPDLVTIYDTVRVTETRRETLRVPTEFTVSGCFAGEPLRRDRALIGPTTYTLTYFDPEARRYKQKTYEAGRPTWALWPETEIRTTPWGLQAHLAAGLRWRDWTLTAGYTLASDRRGWTTGLRWQPFTFTP